MRKKRKSGSLYLGYLADSLWGHGFLWGEKNCDLESGRERGWSSFMGGVALS